MSNDSTTPTTPVSADILGQRIFSLLDENNKIYDKPLLLKAIEVAVDYHGDQKRASGDPYYAHPIAVAEILAELNLDPASIITGLLHDTVEDTELTVEDIEREFGHTIAELVSGVTKLTNIELPSASDRQAENFRKLLVAISRDIRTLLVKLADRLHNMRTLHFIPKPEKRQRIARETMEIYAPLAERIGMQKIKDELQDIAFKELNADGYATVMSRLEKLRQSDTDIITQIESELTAIITEAQINCSVEGREKRPYSIWRKMHKKNTTFEQLSDIIAFRIIVGTVGECYHVLGLIHCRFNAVPSSFKDFISTQKNNGYQSLHTVIIGPQKRRIEIQIRTQDMHDVAELGVAAHWSYKQDVEYSYSGRQFRWIRELLHIIEQTNEPVEFLENTKLEMYHDQVFCFTPRGDLIAMPVGATPVDFAYAVHSEIGKTCVGCKINGRIMPLRTQLQHGDQVEVLQSASQTPSPTWQSFVITGKARSEIRRFIRLQEQEEYARVGQAMLEKALPNDQECSVDDLIEANLNKFNKSKIDDIYIALGKGDLTRTDILSVLYPEKTKEHNSRMSQLLSKFIHGNTQNSPLQQDDTITIPVNGETPGMALHFAACCTPLPGEDIVGITNSGKGTTIHTRYCNELENFIDKPDRWVNVKWEETTGEEQTSSFVAILHATVLNQQGTLATIARVIAEADVNITNFRIIRQADDFYDMIFHIDVQNLNQFNHVMELLSSEDVVHTIERYQEGNH